MLRVEAANLASHVFLEMNVEINQIQLDWLINALSPSSEKNWDQSNIL